MRFIVVIIAAAIPVVHAGAGETDQFLTWGVELHDSAAPFNEYLNEEIESFLDGPAGTRFETSDEMVRAVYFHLFNGLHASRVRQWLQRAPEVDRYPDHSVSWWDYQSQSIYNRLSFPYFLPLSRTVRVGDVYCGIDKFGHLFGFGRRFFNHYQRMLDGGASEDAAMEAVIMRGVLWENLTVGKLVDGVFSYADIEAGFQGMLLARDLADAKQGYLVRGEGRWNLARPIDIRDYVTPDFDESYNPNHYWALRKQFVLPTLRQRYFDDARLASVQQRFARYRLHAPSYCREVLARHFDGMRINPQRQQFNAAFGLPVGLQFAEQMR